MKHLAQIQIEFLKHATWEDLSLEQQKEYLSKHPKSKKKITTQHNKNNWTEKVSLDSTILYENLKKKFKGKIEIDLPSDALKETIEMTLIDKSSEKKLFKYLDQNGWYIAKNHISYNGFLEIQPKYSKAKITNIPQKLYHITPVSNTSNIEENGLELRSSDVRHKYPPRVYVSDNKESLMLLAKELKKWKKNEEYTMFEIDTDNLKMDLYKDKSSAHTGHFYIQDIDKIPKSNLKKLDIKL